MTTRRPPSAAIRMVVLKAALTLDLRVVVMFSGAPFPDGIERSSNVGTPLVLRHGGWPLFGHGVAPATCTGGPGEAPGPGVPHSTTGCRCRYLVIQMRRKNLLTQVLVATLLLMVAAVVAAGVAGNPNLDVGSRPGLALVLGFGGAPTLFLDGGTRPARLPP